MKERSKLRISVVLFLSLGMVFVGCGGGDGGGGDATGGLFAINGYVQKGPFISGSSITIQELDKNLDPTGNSYQTTTSDDFGAFSLGSHINSKYTEVIATGFYFNEVGGELSAANLTLRTTTDLSTSEDVNINILTTLEQDRIEYLIANEGLAFTEARTQAETEVLSIFNISGDNISTFDQMDISQEGDSNAILLAVSSILQGTNTVAELSELISKINLDMKEDGILDNPTYIDEIKNNSMNLNLDAVRANLFNRYESLGLTVTIPGFEAYVDSDGDSVLNGDDDDLVNKSPENVSAARGNSMVVISWDRVKEATKYSIYWSTSTGVSKTNYEEKIGDISGTSYTHSGLINGTTYYYVVTGENSLWESGESSEVNATPSPPPNTVVDTISVGRVPEGVAVTPNGSYVYVANSGEKTVSVIQTSDNTVIDTISVTNYPRGVAVTPNGSYVYVADYYYNVGTVSVIQTSDNTVIDTISVGDGPEGVAVTPDGSYVYVTNFWGGTVSVIQASDNTVIDTISVSGGPSPRGIAVTPSGSYVYVAKINDDTVSVIQTSDNTVIDTISMCDGPEHVAVTPNGSYVYVTNTLCDTVSVIQTSYNTVIDTISVGDQPHCLAVTPNGRYVYVTHDNDVIVSVIGFSE